MRISDWSSDVCSSDLHRSLDVTPGNRSPDFQPEQDPGKAESGWQLYLCDRPSGPGCRQLDRYCRRTAEHTSELQSLMSIPYAVFCLNKTKNYPSVMTLYHMSFLQHTTNLAIYMDPSYYT